MHVIPGLRVGGAERMLVDLVHALGAPDWQHSVFNMQAGGALAAPLAASGAHITCGHMPPGRPTAAGLRRLCALFQQTRPHIVQGWMYSGNLAALVAARLSQFDGPVAWNIHSASPTWPGMRWAHRAVTQLNARISSQVQALLYVARTSAHAHAQAGFATAHQVVVPGGIDTAHFVAHPRSRALWRRRLKLAQHTPLVGLIARCDPIKAHDIFLQAAADYLTHEMATEPAVHFVLVGEGLDHLPLAWRHQVTPQLAQRLHWLGAHPDPAPILQALDVCTLSSHQEALPKVLLEALSCETLCVATAVGDCPELLADVGWVVPPGAPQALAQGWRHALTCSAQARRVRLACGRKRVESAYSAEHFAQRMAKLYSALRTRGSLKG